MLTSLVTRGLQLRASDIITESLTAVDFASLVLVAYVMRELYTFLGDQLNTKYYNYEPSPASSQRPSEPQHAKQKTIIHLSSAIENHVSRRHYYNETVQQL